MVKYELTFILKEESELKNIKSVLQSLSAKIANEQKWEKRRMSYPIDKISDADYYTWEIDIDNTSVSELKKKLNFNEKLLRYLLLKREEK